MFIGEDPHFIIIVWSLYPTTNYWMIDIFIHNLSFTNNQGPVWTSQFLLVEIKSIYKVETSCITYKVTKFINIHEKEGYSLPFYLTTYWDLTRNHMVFNGM